MVGEAWRESGASGAVANDRPDENDDDRVNDERAENIVLVVEQGDEEPEP